MSSLSGNDCGCKTDISCEAENCKYNEQAHCTAKHVDVSGNRAKTSDQTECATFRNK